MEEMVVSKRELNELQDQINILRLKVHNLENDNRKRETELRELKESMWRDRQDVWQYISDANKEAKKCKTIKK